VKQDERIARAVRVKPAEHNLARGPLPDIKTGGPFAHPIVRGVQRRYENWSTTRLFLARAAPNVPLAALTGERTRIVKLYLTGRVLSHPHEHTGGISPFVLRIRSFIVFPVDTVDYDKVRLRDVKSGAIVCPVVEEVTVNDSEVAHAAVSGPYTAAITRLLAVLE
jgi:hypothetical protein